MDNTHDPVPFTKGCTVALRNSGKPYPRTCKACGLGPCQFFKEEKSAALASPHPSQPVGGALTSDGVQQRWEVYAKKAGLLDDKGRAIEGQASKAQSSWFTWEACEKALAATPQSEQPAKSTIPLEASIAWQAGNTWPNERKAVTVEGHAWYRHDHPSVAAHSGERDAP